MGGVKSKFYTAARISHFDEGFKDNEDERLQQSDFSPQNITNRELKKP
mgnify:CR=1 FL=1